MVIQGLYRVVYGCIGLYKVICRLIQGCVGIV